MTAIRLCGDYVVVPPADTAQPELLANGAIDIDDAGRISGVGAESELGPAPAEVHRIGGLLMPGLVNAHAHGPMSLVRSAGDGLPLQTWLTEGVWPREGLMTPDDVVVGMQLASIEMLLGGVTTSVEMYLFEDAVAAAIDSTGARAQIMAGVISAIAPDAAAFRARLDAVGEFHGKRHDPSGLISVGVGPHSVWDLGPERLAEVATLAQELDAPLHVHLEETSTERQQILDEHGKSATQLLADGGALDGHVVGAHGVWLSDQDLELLGQANASIVHCPTSNLKLGSGIARVSAMLQAGVGVAIGTDGAASNDDLNMWEEMRLAALLARGSSHDPTAMSAPAALALATNHGAQAMGIEDIGELRAGAWADVVRVDLDHPAFAPGLAPEMLAHLVWAGGSHHVTDVWVAGRRVVHDREITTVDRSAIQAQARDIGHRLAG